MKTTILIIAVFLFFFSTASAAVAAAATAHKNREPIIQPTFKDKACVKAADCKTFGFGYSCDPSTKTCRKYF